VGLKKDIEDAFIKNITPDKDNEFQMSAEGQKKVKVLAEDLSKAISQFILKQDFQVNDLETTVEIPRITSTVVGATLAGGPILPGATATGPTITTVTKGEVKRDGGGQAKLAATNSLVKLNQVKKGSL
jgi:hypothetical protein